MEIPPAQKKLAEMGYLVAIHDPDRPEVVRPSETVGANTLVTRIPRRARTAVYRHMSSGTGIKHWQRDIGQVIGTFGMSSLARHQAMAYATPKKATMARVASAARVSMTVVLLWVLLGLAVQVERNWGRPKWIAQHFFSAPQVGVGRPGSFVPSPL